MGTTRILVVEDDQEIARGLQVRLKAAGHQVQLAHDGKQALSLVQANRPDLILLDMRMPVMDGLTVLTHLRAEPATCSIPVVALSADVGGQWTKNRALELGARYFVQKPYEIKRLLAAVDAALHQPRQAS